MNNEGVWEYGLVKEVCWKRRSVCGVCTLQYLSISMEGRSINNNNSNKNDDNDNDNDYNDHRDGDNIDDDVVGEEVKVTKVVVVEGW